MKTLKIAIFLLFACFVGGCSKTEETKIAPENINQPYELVFTSSNPSVATVSSDGVLKAIKAGQTTKGIEFCSNLETLCCQNNEITELNVKDCKKLSNVRCDTNKIVSLDVSSHHLTSLEQTKCLALKSLMAAQNDLEQLDISQNTSLINLRLSGNPLKTLYVWKNFPPYSSWLGYSVPNTTQVIEKY